MKLRCLFVLFQLKLVSSFFWQSSFKYGVTGVTYQLYTKANPVNGQALIYGNTLSVSNSNFDRSKPTRLIIHGSGQNGRSAINKDIKNGFLTRGDYNVIVADWSALSGAQYQYGGPQYQYGGPQYQYGGPQYQYGGSQYQNAGSQYQYARYNVNPAGLSVASFISWMNMNYNTMQIVGYDLGAHVAGIAGRNTVNGRVAKIIGLDPSLPLFNENVSNNRLNAGDAEFVEVFHSNAGVNGIRRPIGDTDYYINGGTTQPECTTNTCSHYRSVVVYSKLLSAQNNYVITPCENLAELVEGCQSDPLEEFIEEFLVPTGIYQIVTTNAEALINKDTEIVP